MLGCLRHSGFHLAYLTGYCMLHYLSYLSCCSCFFQLSHFLVKNNLSEKNSSQPGIKPVSFSIPVKHYQLSYSDIVTKYQENYLFNLRIS